MDLIGLFLSLVLGLFIYAGSLCGLKYLKRKKFLEFSISLIFGVLSALILCRLLPDSFKIINNEIGLFKSLLTLVISILIGFFIIKTLDMVIKHHSIKSKSDNRIFHLGMISSISFIYLNFVNGIYIYSIPDSFSLGSLLIMGICNISIGLYLIATLTKKLKLKNALQFSLGIALSSLLASILVCLFGINVLFKGILVAVLIGVLIYLTIYEIFYQIHNIKNKKTVKLGIYIEIILIVVFLLIKFIIG